jgi:DNA polymerase I
VHHCDVRSLYPSLMLTQKIGPASDELGVFHTMLDQLRTYRFDAKRRIARARTVEEKKQMDALQGTFKVLINSFYGYLGFAQGKFCDFDAAEKVTAEGRSLLNFMIEELKRLGAKPIEIDTDGVYFVPPAGGTKKGAEARKQKFRRDFAKTLPEGIEIEFDGEYKSMYSYKMKNYALLSHDGEMVIRGGALKSRGLEPYLRAFLREMIRLKLTGEDDMIPALHEKYRSAIAGREWPVTELAKTATLQDTPSTYATKVSQKSRGRDAAYELALKSAREYRPGDQITYYVTGKKKSVAAHTFAKPASEWDPADRDENVAYYTAKLDALYAKFYDRSGG